MNNLQRMKQLAGIKLTESVQSVPGLNSGYNDIDFLKRSIENNYVNSTSYDDLMTRVGQDTGYSKNPDFPELCKQAYDSMYGDIFDTDTDDSACDYTDWTMRQGEQGNYASGMHESLDQDSEIQQLKAKALENSRNGYVQHVNKDKRYGDYYISDWYDYEETIASYENGRELMHEDGSIQNQDANIIFINSTGDNWDFYGEFGNDAGDKARMLKNAGATVKVFRIPSELVASAKENPSEFVTSRLGATRRPVDTDSKVLSKVHEETSSTAWSTYHRKHGKTDENIELGNNSDGESGWYIINSGSNSILSGPYSSKLEAHNDGKYKKWYNPDYCEIAHGCDDGAGEFIDNDSELMAEDGMGDDISQLIDSTIMRLKVLSKYGMSYAVQQIKTELSDEGIDSDDIKYILDNAMEVNENSNMHDTTEDENMISNQEVENAYAASHQAWSTNAPNKYDLAEKAKRLAMEYAQQQSMSAHGKKFDPISGNLIDENFNTNNGYDEIHSADGTDYFPTGADSPAVKKVGPSGARQGDNPEQKKMQVDEVHKELVYGYRAFLKESSNSKKKLNENQQITNLIADDIAGKFEDLGGEIDYSGPVTMLATVPGRSGDMLDIAYQVDIKARAEYNVDYDEHPTGWNYRTDDVVYSKEAYAEVGKVSIQSVNFYGTEPFIVNNNEMSLQEAQKYIDPSILKLLLDPLKYTSVLDTEFDKKSNSVDLSSMARSNSRY